ncbi:tail completion protein gp17 [Citrobacter amalonaticus]|uniref:tail completion protein gp17 n=1 Tax=Citrobacter amalonaticus TaxID=35703 RepID=UPI0035634B4C
MIAPFFSVCSVNLKVKELLGDDPVRIYPFGMHDDGLVYPYAVWQNIDGEPENYLKQNPDIDRYSIQVDVYGDTDEDTIAVARALRDAIQSKAYITRWNAQGRDPETLKYRYSFDVDWLVNR